MNREINPIKIRVWQEIETVGLCHTTIDLTNKSDVIVYVNEMDDFLGIDRFTGLLDFAGKPIFEGDILKHGDNIGYVFYQGSGFQLSIDGMPGITISNFLDSIMEEYDVEIIGNMHEHPELLEGEE